MGHTGCSQERWGEGEQPGQTYLLVHVWVKGTVLSKEAQSPRADPSPYILHGKIRISPLGKGEQTAWSLGHRIHGSREKSQMPSPGGRGVKLHADQKSPADGGGTDSLELSPLPDTAPAQLKPKENSRGCPPTPSPSQQILSNSSSTLLGESQEGEEKFSLRGAKEALEGGLNNSPHVDLSVSCHSNKTLGQKLLLGN